MDWKTDWGLRGRMVLTMFLLFALYVVFAGALFWYSGSLLVMGLFIGGFSIVQFLYSHKITLWSMGAKEVSPQEYPELHDQVERLSRQADLPKPTVAVSDSQVPNAFATGPTQKKGVVCVTSGILKRLDDDELEGVLAHELAHIKNRDMAVMTIASLLSTIAFVVVRWGWLFGGNRRNGGGGIIVAIVVSLAVWVVSFLLIRALSRYREYAADRGAASITGDPAALASALRSIDDSMGRVPKEDLRSQNEMNAFFIIPIKSGIVGRLFSTHPPTEKRIDRLQDMAREMES